jgi:hypothetical protein
MVGYDLHLVMPPGSPTPGPPGPHIAMSALMGTGATAQMAPTETSHFGWTILRGSDIGPLIPHAPLAPNCLLPIILLSSASKSHFGSSKFLVKNKPAAAALLVVVNPNLNCADPVPMPLDGVVTLTAHFVDMTLGDILSGFAFMAIDCALAWAMNWVSGKAFGKLSQRLYETALFGPMMAMFEKMGFGRVSTWLLQHDFQEMMAKGFFAKLGQLVGADFLGSPLGYSFPVNLFGAIDSFAGGKVKQDSDRGAMEEMHDAVQRYIDGPGPETVNVPPGASAGGAPGADPGAGAGGAPGAGGSGPSGASADPGAGGGGAPSASADPGAGGGSSTPANASGTSAPTPGDRGGVCGPDAPAASTSSPTTSSPSQSLPPGQGGVCGPDDPEGSGGPGKW